MYDVLSELTAELNYRAPALLKTEKCERGFRIEKEGARCELRYSDNVMLARALLEMKSRGNADYVYEYIPKMERQGIMFDCSRNGVLNMPTIKRLIRMCALMGYNMFLLYMEDVYTIDKRPYFGYLRGRYSAEELKEVAEYARAYDIEAVPCIQTLAHLETVKKWADLGDKFDLNDILLCDYEPTYELIDDMFAAMRKSFSTDKINIGMDEAEMVGLGKYLKKYGYHDRFSIILKHLNRVCAIAEKYGFKPIMWSDMFFRIVNDGNYYGENSVPREVIEKVPQNVSLAYWDYRDLTTEHYDRMIREHMKFNRDIWMVNTSWKCIGIVPHNYYTFRTFDALLPAVKKYGLKNFYTTCWGDNGAECSVYGVIPSWLYISLGLNDVGGGAFERLFSALTDMPLQDFLLIDAPNMMGNSRLLCECPTKYFLYSDLFSGFLDARCYDEYETSMKETVKKLAACSGGKFSKAFDVDRALADVLEIKLLLGKKTRAAYKGKDIAALKELAEEIYPELAKRIEKFHNAMYNRWNDENKPQGFEVQDIRIGGLLQRVRTCKRRLDEFLLSGKPIEELDEEILPFKHNAKDDEHMIYYGWNNYVTVNNL